MAQTVVVQEIHVSTIDVPGWFIVAVIVGVATGAIMLGVMFWHRRRG